MKLDKYHYHEAIDRTHVFQASFEDHLATHPAIVGNEELKQKAEEIQKALGDLYQLIGNNKTYNA